jgi:hypothetical protein
MTFDEAKGWAVIIGTSVAAIGLLRGLYEYQMQNAQKRAESYLKLREKFKESTRFKGLFELLEHDDPKLAGISYEIKQDFLGFYEDIAMFVNSGLLKRDVAHYMFSYYALKCANSKHFWETRELEKDSQYWALFWQFVRQMQQADNELKANPAKVSRYVL